jgi:hypothetical protein
LDGIGIEHVYYNGNKLSDFGDPTGLKKLGVEKTPPSVTRGVLLDMAGPLRHRRGQGRHSLNVKEIQDVAPDATGRARGASEEQKLVAAFDQRWGLQWLLKQEKPEITAVYGADRTKIDSIERVMIDKVSGKVSYAVLGFGGFLGIGDDHYPLPWQSLKYDTDLGGYVTGITEAQLQDAPRYSNNTAWNWDDPKELGP